MRSGESFPPPWWPGSWAGWPPAGAGCWGGPRHQKPPGTACPGLFPPWGHGQTGPCGQRAGPRTQSPARPWPWPSVAPRRLASQRPLSQQPVAKQHLFWACQPLPQRLLTVERDSIQLGNRLHEEGRNSLRVNPQLQKDESRPVITVGGGLGRLQVGEDRKGAVAVRGDWQRRRLCGRLRGPSGPSCSRPRSIRERVCHGSGAARRRVVYSIWGGGGGHGVRLGSTPTAQQTPHAASTHPGKTGPNRAQGPSPQHQKGVQTRHWVFTNPPAKRQQAEGPVALTKPL